MNNSTNMTQVYRLRVSHDNEDRIYTSRMKTSHDRRQCRAVLTLSVCWMKESKKLRLSGRVKENKLLKQVMFGLMPGANRQEEW